MASKHELSEALKESAARFAYEMAKSTGEPMDKVVAATRACIDNCGLTPRRIDAEATEIMGAIEVLPTTADGE